MNDIEVSSQKILHLEVPAKAEYLSLMRLVVAGVADRIGMPAESVADIKVALSEASSNVIRHAYSTEADNEKRVIEIDCFSEDGALLLMIVDYGHGMSIPPPPSDGLGFGIMSSIMDKVDVETDETGTSVIMRKLLASGRNRRQQ